MDASTKDRSWVAVCHKSGVSLDGGAGWATALIDVAQQISKVAKMGLAV